MRAKFGLAAASGALVVCSAAVAQPVLTGALTGPFGSAIATQGVNTGFGNNTDPSLQFANGSELNAAYAYLDSGFVRLLLTGNLESNFNKLVLFIDNGSGAGQNTITGGADLPGNYNGMTFDAGFNATHYIIANGGDVGGGTFGWFVNAGNLLAGEGGFVGGNDGQSGGALSGGGYATSLIRSAIDNSNLVGVDGNPGGALVDPLTATTGMEFAIDLSWLGVTGPFRVTAFVNGGGHDFASNQFLGALPAFTGNLGGDGTGGFTGNLAGIDLNNFAGQQFFTVIPAPGAVALLALAGLAARRRRD